MELVLVRDDIRQLKQYIFQDNDINNWDKVIILYNFYLFYNHLYILYSLFNYINHDKSTSFSKQFKHIYMFFFILCNLKNSYMYFILNVSKINLALGNNLYEHTKQYFM